MPRARSCHHQSTLGPVMLSPHPPWESLKNDIHQTYIPTVFCVGGQGCGVLNFFVEVVYGEGSIFGAVGGKNRLPLLSEPFCDFEVLKIQMF